MTGYVALNNAKKQVLEFKQDLPGRILRQLAKMAIEIVNDLMYLALTESTINECTQKFFFFPNGCKKGSDEKHLPSYVVSFLPRVFCHKQKKMIAEWIGTKLLSLIVSFFVPIMELVFRSKWQ